MKHLLLSFIIVAFGLDAKAQFYNGVIYPSTTITDLNYQVWHMDSILDEGKPVFLFLFQDISETSWDYHVSGALQGFYNAYSASAGVFALPSAQVSSLNGNGDTQGNWVANTPYPIAHPHESIAYNAALALSSIGNLADQGWQVLDNVYMVCPNRRIYQLGFPSLDSLVSAMNSCEVATQTHDARVIVPDLDLRGVCPEEARPITVHLSNMGTAPLTSCELLVKSNNQTVQTLNWTGNLPTYHLDTLQLVPVVSDGNDTAIEIFPQNPNNVPDENTGEDTIHLFLSHATYWDANVIKVEIQTDGYGHQIYWDITDANGEKIAHDGNEVVGAFDGSIAPTDITQYQDYQYITKTASLSGFATECMTIRVLSGLGYGTCCIFGPGYIRFKKNDEVIFEFTDFGRRAYAKLTTTFVSSTDDAPTARAVTLYPNPTDGNITAAFHLDDMTSLDMSVYNIMGQRVLSVPIATYLSGKQEVGLQTQTLPNGIYWLTLRDAARVQAVKFVVAK